jgi:rSAM/selenodomain-associated transferase 2
MAALFCSAVPFWLYRNISSIGLACLMSTVSIPELSIIIPLLNEEQTLPQLFHSLEAQTGLCCQVIFCDGGSVDNSLSLLENYAHSSCHQVVVLSGEQGRGWQMNQGADVANSERLLFLHADSFWHQTTLLQDALNCFAELESESRSAAIAAHFSLQFSGSDCHNRFYRYLSEKSQLNRPGTIYGDQGMLLSKKLWHEIGGFSDESVILEDVLFVEQVAQLGQWVLLPQVIFTSNRRYQREGRLQRVIRNGLMLIVAGAGFGHLLSSSAALSGGYHAGERGSTLSSFAALASLLHRMSLTRYGCFWYGCGREIAHHFWLVIYAASWAIPLIDCDQRRTILSFYDRRVAPLMIYPIIYTVFAVLSWFLFYLFYLCLPLSWLVQRKGKQRQFPKEHV